MQLLGTLGGVVIARIDIHSQYGDEDINATNMTDV